MNTMQWMADTSMLLAQAASDQNSKTLLDHIKSGGWIGHTIILLSIVAVGLTIMHLFQIRRVKLAPPEVVVGVRGLLRGGDVAGAVRACKEEVNDCYLTRVLGAALDRCLRSPFGLMELRTALEEAGQEQSTRLHRSTDGLGLIGTVAPMLGLLGTVVGMVGAFETIATTEGTAKPFELAGYISIALITTVEGLIVAIPCTAAYTFFRNRIDRLTSEVGAIMEEIMGDVEGVGQGGAATGAAGARPPSRPAPRPTPSGMPGAGGAAAGGGGRGA
ncbi:MAG: MotA/TolQ/ExbB proton channel family protein [Phycisphaerales bacterium]